MPVQIRNGGGDGSARLLEFGIGEADVPPGQMPGTPMGSLTNPDLFIPLAESTGQIRLITDYVLDRGVEAQAFSYGVLHLLERSRCSVEGYDVLMCLGCAAHKFL